jgi:hypothetical protein
MSSQFKPRWGLVSKETVRRRAAWAEHVGKTEPTPLRKCGECGGWASKQCKHLKT